MDFLLRAGNGTEALVALRDNHAGQALTAPDIHHRVGKVQRNIVVVQALLDVARQAARIGLNLVHTLDVRALERHAAGHDQADVAAAEDDDLAANHHVLQVDVALRHTGGIYARRTMTRRGQRAAGTFAAAHGQQHSIRLELHQAMVPAGGGDDLIARHIQHGAVGDGFNPGFLHHVDEALGIFRAGEGLAEARQTEAVVDTLAQDAAQHALTLEDEDVVHALFLQAQGCGKASRAAAYDDGLLMDHACSPPLTWPVNMAESPLVRLTSVTAL